jgi:hypothetical protein
MRNDVLATLEMMLTFGQMMLCPVAQMKNPRSEERGFLAPPAGLEYPNYSSAKRLHSSLFIQNPLEVSE